MIEITKIILTKINDFQSEGYGKPETLVICESYLRVIILENLKKMDITETIAISMKDIFDDEKKVITKNLKIHGLNIISTQKRVIEIF